MSAKHNINKCTFFHPFRQRAVGGREQKIGVGVRPEKELQALAANKNAGPRLSMQVT